MPETYKPIADMVDEAPQVDNRGVFDQAWELLTDLKAKVDARFDVEPDASSQDVHAYGGENGPAGHLHTFAGPEVDWMVHSWMGDPEATFSNMHLTVWLGAQTWVPHLGIAWGTVPDLWFYMDYVPRKDLLVDLDYLDRYYTPQNEPWLDFREHSDLAVFVSREIYIREALTETAHCYHGPAAEAFPTMATLVHEHIERWLDWVDEGDAVDPADRAALSARDEVLRRNVAERDPANVLGVRMFGEELTERLVATLWGRDRATPRAGL